MDRVTITEVGPRDGLQNESVVLPVSAKLDLIRSLSDAGLRRIEAGSFVSPKWVPAMEGATEIWQALREENGGKESDDVHVYMFLVPNARGLENALASGVESIAFFTAASETFNRTNVNIGVEEHFAALTPLVEQAKAAGVYVRGYLSTITHCPYEGRVAPERVLELTLRLLDMGCDEVSLGETTGRAVPNDLQPLLSGFTLDRPIHWHFHDTWGSGIANVQACLERGWRAFDASAAGLGGCPYAKGAGGNIATEDLVSLCEREGLTTGVDLPKLARASSKTLDLLGRSSDSKVRRALLGGDSESIPRS